MENEDQVLADVAAPVVEQPVVEKADPVVKAKPVEADPLAEEKAIATARIVALEAKVADLEAKIAKLDEFLGPHGHNRVIPEVVEPQCQSEIAEPQTE